MTTPARALGRAVWLGLCGGLFLGGLVIMAFAARALLVGPDCAGLSDSECALEKDILTSISRRQALFGGLLSLLGVCVYSLLKSKERERLRQQTPST